MKILVILVITAIIASVSCTFCPEGMFWDICGHHKCRFSCTHPLGPKGCIPKCGPPGCTCFLHLVMRETDGKCVKKKECSIDSSLATVPSPPVVLPLAFHTCPEGMFWNICGHHKCRFTCAHPQGPEGCIPKCGPPGCTCLLFLVFREKDRKCVRKEECPIDSSLATVPPPPVIHPVACNKCPEGMFWDICGHHKCRFSCAHPQGPKGCIPKCGPPGCTCLLHLVMRETDGKCVKKEECTTYNPPALPPQEHLPYPPHEQQPYPPQEQLPYPPQPGKSYPPQEQLPYPPQRGRSYPPQPGRSYPPQEHLPYPPQPGRSYSPQERLPYPPQPGRSYPPQPWRSYPPQKLLPYPPQPGPPYPDKPGYLKIPSNIELSLAPYGVERPPKQSSYPQRDTYSENFQKI